LACSPGTTPHTPDALAAQDSPVRTGHITQSRTTAIVRAAEEIAPAVVSVNVRRREQVRARGFFDSFFLPPDASRVISGLGSGFIFDATGLVLTNEHVVQGAEQIMVTLPDGRDLDAELVGSDPVTDVAVLRIRSESPLPVAPLGTAKGLMIGEWALAVGNPFGNLISNAEPTVTAGVVSAVGRHIVPDGRDAGFYLGMIQTDAAINPGNSGGPLVNALGEVIGVNTSIFSRSGGSEGLGFAIPIERALRVAADLVASGQVERPWLGMDVGALEADEWGRTRGVQITRVLNGSPAGRAGVAAGARLARLNDLTLTAPLDFQAALLDLSAGDTVQLGIEGQREPTLVIADPLPSRAAQRVEVVSGVWAVSLTAAIAAERRVASEQGALLTQVAGPLATQLGFRGGDVLLRINGAPIPDALQAAKILGKLQAQGGRVRIEFERGGSYNVRDFVW